MKTVVIVQARLGSTRLPGKVLRDLAGGPLLMRQLERIRAAHSSFNLVVATTIEEIDDPIRDLCKSLTVDCYSGNPTDLLDRHYQCAKELGADHVVKIPSDCPLIDPDIIDRVLTQYYKRYPEFDYVSNLHPATFPDGNDVEIMKMSVLEEAWHKADRGFEREHTTPYIWERPDIFNIGNVALPEENYSITHRWTIDYEEDYQFIAKVYCALWRKDRPIFNMKDILELINENPHLAQINSKYAGVNWYRNHLHELKTINENETRKITIS